MTLGDIIKKYREENALTMEYVAKLCGITKGYVAMLERNINSKTGKPVKPTLETILKVCQGLKLDVDSVFSVLDDDYVVSLPLKKRDLLNLKEQKCIASFRLLNSEGQSKAVEYINDLVASGNYSASGGFDCQLAAHERTDIEGSEEDRKHDIDILNDDNF